MSEYSKLLVKHGFMNAAGEAKFSSMAPKQKDEAIKSMTDKEAEIYANEENAEVAPIQQVLDRNYTQYVKTGFPEPFKRYKMVFQSNEASIEEPYYWILSQLRVDLSFTQFHKTVDNMAASEQSSFWGAAQQRLKIQQDSISQYLATIGNMIKNLFQLVRELRIIDERIELYDKWDKSKSADVTLKGLYVDLVEGATKNPGSVYGLAQNVGFTILPDLFFNTHVHTPEAVDNVVDNMKYNVQVKNVLRRKLYSYVNWKEKTDKEIRARRKFQTKYLKQHWAAIKMYMEWLKPYLRNVRRMQMKEKNIESVDIVSAFETAVTEIEFIAAKETDTGTHPVILVSFRHLSSPQMNFKKDQYAHKGPAHNGRIEMEFRAYGWTPKQIESFKNYRREETFELFSAIDESVKAAMDALGDDLEKYLAEADGISTSPKDDGIPTKIKRSRAGALSAIDPFISVFRGFWELFESLIPISSFIPNKKKGGSKPRSDDKAKISANNGLWLVYKNFKKAHRMITW